MRLPDLDMARAYPTYGPEGESEADINGRSVSIELFLGRDVLTFDGELAPVQWTSYVPSMKAYQGEVTRKADIQKRFREKVRMASSVDPDDPAWADLACLITHLIPE
jgi:hypothetical protein